VSKPSAQSAPPAAIQFTNATEAAGIKFKHFKGNQGVSINREEFGPGVCVADFDGDGWQDIYFVNGRDLYDRGISVSNALYRNNHDGTFTDVTEKAGVPGTGYGLGCVWGDFDNDGFPDLFVTQYGKNVLYRNNGNGTFTDVTDKAGVGGLESGTFHSGATFLDYDRDGWLDLYVSAVAPPVNIGVVRTRSITTTTMAPSPTWRSQLGFINLWGRTSRSRRVITTTMAGPICLWPTMV
jgi:hypothetical protein